MSSTQDSSSAKPPKRTFYISVRLLRRINPLGLIISTSRNTTQSPQQSGTSSEDPVEKAKEEDEGVTEINEGRVVVAAQSDQTDQTDQTRQTEDGDFSWVFVSETDVTDDWVLVPREDETEDDDSGVIVPRNQPTDDSVVTTPPDIDEDWVIVDASPQSEQ